MDINIASVTSEALLNHIVDLHYPNEVVFHCTFSQFGGLDNHYIVRCQACHDLGLSWYHTVNMVEIESHPQWGGVLREVLIQHASQHNELVQRIHNTFNFTPKHQGVASQFPSSNGCPTGHQGAVKTKDEEAEIKAQEEELIKPGVSWTKWEQGLGFQKMTMAEPQVMLNPFQNIELSDGDCLLVHLPQGINQDQVQYVLQGFAELGQKLNFAARGIHMEFMSGEIKLSKLSFKKDKKIDEAEQAPIVLKDCRLIRIGEDDYDNS